MKTDTEMRKILKVLKSQRQHYAVPEPDADFEKRILKGLRESKAWNRKPFWDSLNVFRFELNIWRLAGGTLAFALIAFSVGRLVIPDLRKTATFAQNEHARRHPELASILQRGGQKALDLWVKVSGDPAAQGSSSDVENAPLTEAEQKRILAELEKKWSAAL